MKNQTNIPEKALPYVSESGKAELADDRRDENERRISELNEKLAEYMIATKLWKI